VKGMKERAKMADLKPCSEPFWHETYNYCPCCSWRQRDEDTLTRKELEKRLLEQGAYPSNGISRRVLQTALYYLDLVDALEAQVRELWEDLARWENASDEELECRGM
jgi:hypothetical protein